MASPSPKTFTHLSKIIPKEVKATGQELWYITETYVQYMVWYVSVTPLVLEIWLKMEYRDRLKNRKDEKLTTNE